MIDMLSGLVNALFLIALAVLFSIFVLSMLAAAIYLSAFILGAL